MRITFLLPPVSLSGGNKVIVIYAQALMRRGHTVTLVSPPPKKIPLRQKLRAWTRDRSWVGGTNHRPSYLDGSGLDHRLLDRWRPIADGDVPDADIVIATWWETAEWVNALSSSKGAKVYFIQGHEIFPYLPIVRCRATYRLPLHKIVVSAWLKEIMRSEYGDDNVDHVPNSVDKDQFYSPARVKQRIPTVGFLYSGVSIKGLDVILAALKLLRRELPQLRLISFGAIEPIPELPLVEKTEYHQSPKPDEIRQLYCSCDVWLTASRTEGFNLTAMEAMACRTPVVSTRTGWPAESIKSGWNGFLVEIDDIDGIARCAELILSQNAEDWQRMSSNAYATVAESSWTASTAMFERALEHACQRAKIGQIGGNCAC